MQKIKIFDEKMVLKVRYIFLFSILFLTSCSAIISQTGLKFSDYRKYREFSCSLDTCNGIQLNNIVSIHSSCERAIIALIGPYPIFPNPFYLYNYYKYKNIEADIRVVFRAEKNIINFDDLKIKVGCNGNQFTLITITKITNIQYDDGKYDYVEYAFKTNFKCKEMEDSLILVSINGLPADIEEQIMFKHKWQFVIE